MSMSQNSKCAIWHDLLFHEPAPSSIWEALLGEDEDVSGKEEDQEDSKPVEGYTLV